MENSDSRKIVIPEGSSDERDISQEVPEKPSSLKPLDRVEVPGAGVYEISVPGDFDSPRFSLVAVDENGEQIPLITIEESEEDGKKVFTSIEDEEVLNLFAVFTDMDKLRENFGLEMDGWLKIHSGI